MVLTILSILLTLQTNSVSINDLIKNSHEYDNQAITIEAEVILEVLERGDFAWININDGTNAIGVYLPIEMTEELKYFGDYNHVGDIVRIEGIFSRNCEEHGGEIDIHATSLKIVTSGYLVEKEVSSWKFIGAFIGFSLSSIALFLYYRVRRKKKEEE